MCAKKVTELAEVAINKNGEEIADNVGVEESSKFEDEPTTEDKEVISPRKSTEKVNKFNNRLKENPAVANTPKHILDLVIILKDNAEIRRFTSLAILNYLFQKGEINNKRGYVGFYWNKFSVKVNGLSREYWYTEKFFIKALVSSFTSFAAVANQTINMFLEKELNQSANDIVSNEEAVEIAQGVLAQQVLNQSDKEN